MGDNLFLAMRSSCFGDFVAVACSSSAENSMCNFVKLGGGATRVRYKETMFFCLKLFYIFVVSFVAVASGRQLNK